jgi:PAS domain-containing protein
LRFDYLTFTWEKISGVTIEDSLSDIRNAFRYIVPEDLKMLMQRIEESLNPLTNFTCEFRFNHPILKEERWFQISSYPRHEGGDIVADGFIYDVTKRKDAEQKVLIQNERLMALDNMPDGVLFRTVRDVTNKSMIIDYVSGTWEKVMGVSAEATFANLQNVFAHVVPEDLKILIHHIYESDDPKKKFNVEVRYIHPVTNKMHWIQVSSYPRRMGDTVISDGFIFDITARKDTENELLAEKERLETLGNNLPNGVLYQFVLDTNTDQIRMPFVSGRWEAITGIPSYVAMANIDTFIAMIHADDLPLVMQAIDNSAKTMTNFHAEFRITVQSHTHWIQMSSHPHPKDALVVWDGIMLDITQRKEAEHDLENEKKRLQVLGDNIPGSTLFQYSRDARTGQMRMLYVSGTWEAVTGIDAKAAMTSMSKVFDAVDPNDLQTFIQSIDDSARTMTDYTFETRFGNRWMSIIARPRLEGKLIVWDCIMTNITQRKEIERQLEAEKTRLQTLGDNLPNSTLYQFVRDNYTRQMRLSYVSGTWESVLGVSAEVSMTDITKVFSMIDPEEFPAFLQSIDDSARTMSIHTFEARFGDRWLSLVGRPRNEDKVIIWDGIITDISKRKENEAELAKYRDNLEYLVQERTDELNTANEELYASNEALYTINDELKNTNQQLADEMKTRAEMMKQLEENDVELAKALSENEYQLAQLDLLVEASGMGLWDLRVVDGDPDHPDNTFVMSDKFRKILGYTNEADFPNTISSWSEKLHSDDKERVHAAFTRHLLDKSGKTPYDIEYRLLKKNGKYGRIKDFGATIRDPEGKAIRMAGAIMEVEKEI